jgi:hypothetical protein
MVFALAGDSTMTTFMGSLTVEPGTDSSARSLTQGYCRSPYPVSELRQ